MLSRPVGEGMVVRLLVTIVIAFLVISFFFRPTPFAQGQATFDTRTRVSDPARRAEDAKTYALDLLAFGRKQIALRGARQPIDVPVGATLSISGWAVDPQTLTKAISISVGLDGEPLRDVDRYGVDRPDVANALQSDGARTSGFVATIALPSTLAGRHVIRFGVRAKSGATFGFPTDIAIRIGAPTSAP